MVATTWIRIAARLTWRRLRQARRGDFDTVQHHRLHSHHGRSAGPSTDEPERRLGPAHDRYLQHHAEPVDFTATPSALLYNTQLPLPPRAAGLKVPKPAHNARYWAKATKGMDFTDADRVDSDDFNQILWKGIMGKQPYPEKAYQSSAERAHSPAAAASKSRKEDEK